ncbi:unnamed protein product [Cladocopium goreaui]|uniref:Uncharacterized protein n=1 Tax=Cladocopium goreaui TaxID=2562237 RepID=A0A9P1FSX3_9DINO|nr:unnamed protein product [Cladocopium goreaui]
MQHHLDALSSMAQQVIVSYGLSKHLGHHVVPQTTLLLGVLDRWKFHGCSRVVQWVWICYLHWCTLERVAQWRDAEDLWPLKVQPAADVAIIGIHLDFQC